MTLKMLRYAEKQGITDVVNTTHYKHPKMLKKSINHKSIQFEIDKLQNILIRENISIKLHFTEILFITI